MTYLQCIDCGELVEVDEIGEHFEEHPEQSHVRFVTPERYKKDYA